MSDQGSSPVATMVKPEPNGRTRRKPSQVADTDSDEKEQDQEDATSRKNKRVKMEAHANGNGSAKSNGKKRVHDDEEQDEEDEDEKEDEGDGIGGIAASAAARSGERKQLVRDTTGYVTGSIVRIACQSFLTYDQVEFQPGPALNMIIGPNGTGKSTIACAIAIGLGFPAKVLGRSTKLSSYCKNDSNDECWIELELKGKPGQKNLVVRRTLSRDSEKSSFTLDGNHANAKEVGERMENLSVQVGNLCTFLPQDRVASFAMMSHSELLRETEKAAGDVNLSSWHQILIDEWKAQKEKQINVETYTKKLDRASTKQAEQEKEVQQFEQRKTYEQDLAVVDVLAKYANYQKVFEQLQGKKADKNRLTNEVKELEAKNRPFKDSKELLNMIAQNSAGACTALEKKIRKAQNAATKKEEQVSRSVLDAQELSDEMKGIRTEEDNRKKAIKENERKIEKLRPLVAGNEPEQANTDEIDRKIAEKTQERNEKGVQIGELKSELSANDRAFEQLAKDRQYRLDRLSNMNRAHVVREENTQRHARDVWTAVCWLRQNKDKFRGEVFEPARLSVFPKDEWNGKKLDTRNDKAILDMVEGPISQDAFKTFLFEYREDYDKFMHEMADTRGLKLNGAELRVSEEIRRSISDEQLHELGFDVLACDLLMGPKPVIVWLANEHNLARTPLQLYRRPLADQKISQMRTINRYYTRDGSVSVKISNYGARKAMTESRALKSAKILSAGVDEERVKEVQRELDQIIHEIQEKRAKQEKTKTIGREISEQVQIIDDERQALKAEREKMIAARSNWFKMNVKLQSLEKQLARDLQLQEKNSGNKKRDEIAKEIKKVMAKRVKLALEYKDHVLEAEQLTNAAIKLHLQALQADSDHRTMEALVRERDEELEARTRELEEVQGVLSALIKDGKTLMKEAESAIEESSDDVKIRVTERRQQGIQDIDTLEGERDELNAKIDCMMTINPGVLEAYKKRKGEIVDLTNNLEEATDELNESKELIESTKAKWLPRLQTLVDDISKRFTVSFDTLGLLGEVRLAQDEDYEKWGIEIMVSFRDKGDDSGDVQLHVLSGQRQSGGERALTTVTYLLALAELARAPFALVDEINQGMDQRAERNMHKMLVETTCKDDVGQYFLLTPKLLPDLVYHEKMKVLVINSGSFIPEDLSLKAMVEKRRQLNKTRRLGSIQVAPV
ncbi:hypothetical protein JCM16303_001107 [Sporobolomyces ruberrimus]